MTITELPQPFALYRVLTGSDDHHFGLYAEKADALALSEAQEALVQRILARLPSAPARILDVDCALGALAGRLARLGYQVVAIASDSALIAYARVHHPGPEYVVAGFLDDDPVLTPARPYDVILFRESLQHLPDLSRVFDRAHRLLAPGTGRVVMCDQVTYDFRTRSESPVHEAKEIERRSAEAGFLVAHGERLGARVAPTCRALLLRFAQERANLLGLFGAHHTSLLDSQVQGWHQQLTWYEAGRLGYELWELRASPYVIRAYRPGDEDAILDAFQAVFRVSRSKEHWHWKFLRNPFGGPYVSNVWRGEELVAHYAAYPVPVWLGDRLVLTYQVGDILTRPAVRGVGRGTTSLLGRAVRHFHRLYCEGRIPFFYGFVTGPHRRFGQMFLNYVSVAPVYEWTLERGALDGLRRHPVWRAWLKGYHASLEERVGAWADRVFLAAREDYGWLVARQRTYLQWRYQDHPDHRYRFVVVRRWGRPVGWWLVRVEGQKLMIGDALFARHTPLAPSLGLAAALRLLALQAETVNEVGAWFSRVPQWWGETLQGLGFRSSREPNDLDLCVTPFDEAPAPETLGERLYFTHGDSDLF